MTGSGQSVRILGLAGSLRAGSYNRMLLRNAVALAPARMRIDVHDLSDIPLYNGDLDTDELRPAPVRRLKDAVQHVDGVLFAMPEYNHSVPGVLQNAIDWVSRPSLRSPLRGKPVAIMGASGGPVGTARGQQVLKLTLMSTLALPMPHPGVVVNLMREKFDEHGELTHMATREFLADFLEQLADWVTRMRPVDTAP